MLQDIFLCVVSEMLVVDVVLAFQNRFDAIGDWGLDHDFVGHLYLAADFRLGRPGAQPCSPVYAGYKPIACHW